MKSSSVAWQKHNVDGVVDSKGGAVEIGIVARDYLGNNFGTFSVHFTGLFTPRSKKALGF